MSYLHEPRMSFGGRFLSDVSTRNNVAANYAASAQQQDLWNVSGGASFEFLDCGILQAEGISEGDPASQFVVTGATDRTSAKMVDLDPDWQMSSEIWALKLRISDRATGKLAFEGEAAVCAFRDLWTRQLGDTSNGQPAGARFVTTLHDVTWGPLAENSTAVQALQEATERNALSVGIHTFGYYYDQTHARYRTGGTMVHIGPHFTGEAKTALVHRRLGAFAAGSGGSGLTIVSDLDFALNDEGTRAHIDVGQGLLLTGPDGEMVDLSTLGGQFAQFAGLSIGLLPLPEPPIFTAIPPAQVETFYDLPQQTDWYLTTGGVVSVDLPANIATRASTQRMAMFARFSNGQILLVAKETNDGIFFRTDHFVRRLDPGQSSSIKVVARQFGKPLAGVSFQTGQVMPQRPATMQGLTVGAILPTDADGVTEIPLAGSNPGNPRADFDLDGQIFALSYSNALDASGQPNLTGTGLGGLDVIPIHVRDPFTIPEAPEFSRDIQPLMAQYAQLYPIMSAHLFDIADYDALVANRQAMLLAFSRDLHDPNYMPVTRDMSAGRIEALVKWLSSETGNEAEPLLRNEMVAGAQLDTPHEKNTEPGVDMKALMATLKNHGGAIPILPLDIEEA